jgi:hypothetical protein
VRTKGEAVSVGQVAFGGLVVALIAVFSVMAFRIAPRIREAAGCRKLFDERVNGYDFEDAKAFLNALTPEGAKAYLKMAMQWDMIFPLLYGAVLCLAIQWATPDAFPVPPFIVALLGLIPVVCDFRENTLVAAMLMSGPDGLKPDLVARASFWTRWKWRTGALAVGLLAVLSLGSALGGAGPGGSG